MTTQSGGTRAPELAEIEALLASTGKDLTTLNRILKSLSLRQTLLLSIKSAGGRAPQPLSIPGIWWTNLTQKLQSR